MIKRNNDDLKSHIDALRREIDVQFTQKMASLDAQIEQLQAERNQFELERQHKIDAVSTLEDLCPRDSGRPKSKAEQIRSKILENVRVLGYATSPEIQDGVLNFALNLYSSEKTARGTIRQMIAFMKKKGTLVQDTDGSYMEPE